MVSAKEWTASASIAPDPEKMAAINLVTAMPRLASIAATIARFPPLVLTWPTYTFEHDRLFASDRHPRCGLDGRSDPVRTAVTRCERRRHHGHEPHGGQGGGAARVDGGSQGGRVTGPRIRPGCHGDRPAWRPTGAAGRQAGDGARAA